MALQDICGFLDTLDDTSPCTYPPNEMGYMWRTASEFDRDSAFHFLYPLSSAAEKKQSAMDGMEKKLWKP